MANTKRSRYETVKHILDEAQGETISDHLYQGYGSFWRRPLAEFLALEIYGQRMIAPAGGKQSQTAVNCGCGCGSSCGCGGGEAESGESGEETAVSPNCWPSGGKQQQFAPAGSQRSEQSGLIKGLRGQAPFDGSQFPPLLWQAKQPVSAENINFIAAWIDDGCPETEAEAPKSQITVLSNKLRDLSFGAAQHARSDEHTNAIREQVGGLKVRKDVRCLNDTERNGLRRAITCMHQYDPYRQDERSWGYWARIHTDSCQHGWEHFLPWHRLYLYFFEQMLQDFDPLITLPYWDWTAYAEDNAKTYNTAQLDLGIIPEAYRCWLDEQAIENLTALQIFSTSEVNSLKKIVGQSFNSGARLLAKTKVNYEVVPLGSNDYQYSDKIRAIYKELRRVNALWHANRWPGAIAQRPTQYPRSQDVDNILAITDFATFGGGPDDDHHFGKLEKVHNGMHNFAGGSNPFYVKNSNPQSQENPPTGDMTDNRVTAYDPIFWAHHCNVDRIWALWQKKNPNVNPEELDGILPPWSLSVREALSTRKLGYEYIKDSAFFPTVSELPMVRFHSEKTAVSPPALTDFQHNPNSRAEVRLHRIQRVANNASIRVFLNTPDANEATPMENNPHFVGEFMTFGGSCYGGPGHCDLPLPRSRRFDKRPLHHHEPRNARLDATDAVKYLASLGQTELSLHLVVLGIDGQPSENALYLDGVSLNLID
ncbi:MAG: tyrosinase family protein [Anaerolineales bacterium]|nr:tyrosinase family protein [Anaerolineales bacterium]